MMQFPSITAQGLGDSNITNTEEFIMPTGVPQLAAWPLSDSSADQEVFQKQLLSFLQLPGETKPSQSYASLFKHWDS